MTKNRHTVLVCNPGTPRVDAFLRACVEGGSSVDVVSYIDLLRGTANLRSVVTRGSVVRLDSPGKAFEVERAILSLGGLVGADALEFRHGELLSPRIWYRGWCLLLDLIASQLSECEPHSLMNDVDEIKAMYDKPTCQSRLASAGISVPRAFGAVSSYESLHELVKRTGKRRLFLKIANGSSAAGVVAYQCDATGRQKAITTVEMHAGQLFNTRRLRVYESSAEVASLVDELGKDVLHVEEWIPKASCGGCVFDLRVVVIGGRVANSLARLSKTPLTNLHLLNKRMSIADLRAQLPALRWEAIEETCERVMREVFPRSLYAGLDVVVARDFKKHFVVEVNAFGDHVNDVLHCGQTTHELELRSLIYA